MPKTQSQENTESKQEGMYLVVTAETPQIQPCTVESILWGMWGHSRSLNGDGITNFPECLAPPFLLSFKAHSNSTLTRTRLCNRGHSLLWNLINLIFLHQLITYTVNCLSLSISSFLLSLLTISWAKSPLSGSESPSLSSTIPCPEWIFIGMCRWTV